MACKPEDLLHNKINLNLFRLFWPELVAAISRYTDSVEFLESNLIELGKFMGNYVGDYWDIKHSNFKKMIKQTFRFFAASKKFKVKKYKDKIEIIDKDCILCRTAIEATKLHYCIVISGFLEGILKKISARFILENLPREFIVNTTMSVSSGDDICKHEILFVYK